MSNEDPPKGYWIAAGTVAVVESRQSTVGASAVPTETLSLQTAAGRAHFESSGVSLEWAFADPANAEFKRMFIWDEINRAAPDAVSAWWWPELKKIARELVEVDPITLGKHSREAKAVTIANIIGCHLGQRQGKPNGRARAVRFYKAARRVMFPPAGLSEWTRRVLTEQKNLKNFWRF